MSQAIHTALPGLRDAQRMLPAPDGIRSVLHTRYTTTRIIQVIDEMAREGAQQTPALAAALAGPTVRESLEKVWRFIRSRVEYVADGYTDQDVKSPARMLSDGYGDCKSYSVLTSAILQNLGIPHRMRYVSYSPRNPDPEHVYVMAQDSSGWIPVDACWKAFGEEKPFYHHQDYDMRISRLTGIGGSLATVLEGDMEQALAAQTALLERQIGVRGPRLVLAAEDDFALAPRIQAKRAARLPVAMSVRTPKQAQAADMVLTALPSAAPYFLYLFVQDPELVAALPESARAQRREAVQTARYIMTSLGLSEAVFFRLLRNGIMSQTGAAPEQLIAAGMGAPALRGVRSLLAAASAIGTAVNVVKKVVPVVRNIFGGKKAAADAEAPAPARFTKDGKPVDAAPAAITAPAPAEDLKKTPVQAVRNFINKVEEKVGIDILDRKSDNTGVAPRVQDAQLAPPIPDDLTDAEQAQYLNIPQNPPAPGAGAGAGAGSGAASGMPGWVLPVVGLAVAGGLYYASTQGKKSRKRKAA